jgi:glycosyltransferase involved in cell wall biosynthesis
MEQVERKAPSISVVVPVYNGRETLAELTARLYDVLAPLVEDLEIIYVNDGSRDASWEEICELARQFACVRGLNHMRNYGQHNATLAGVRAARYDVVVTLDDDLEHPPEEIPKLLAELAKGHDVVYGSPLQEQHGLWRDMASKITKLAIRSTLGVEIAQYESSFRVFRTPLRDAFAHYEGPFVSLDVLLTWSTTRYGHVRIRHDPRKSGVSNYTFGKLVTHALNMMTGFSTLPLRLASVTGFAFTLFGLGVLVYVVGRYVIEGGGVPGFAFLASIIALFSGAQLFALGIIGEYLARMHFRTMGRPLSVVRSITGQWYAEDKVGQDEFSYENVDLVGPRVTEL